MSSSATISAACGFLGTFAQSNPRRADPIHRPVWRLEFKQLEPYEPPEAVAADRREILIGGDVSDRHFVGIRRAAAVSRMKREMPVVILDTDDSSAAPLLFGKEPGHARP